jgi:hypothetical protein
MLTFCAFSLCGVQGYFLTSRLAHLHSKAGSPTVGSAPINKTQFGPRPKGRWTLVAYADSRLTAEYRAGKDCHGQDRRQPEDRRGDSDPQGLLDLPWV